jgi:outer membrane biosynthesis protein TonB
MSKQSHNINLFSQSGCLRLEALELYKEKGLSEADHVAVDEHLLECPMCKEALEGLTMMAEKPGSAFYTNRINKRLRRSHAYSPLGVRERNTAARFGRLLVPAAASIILLMSIIAYFQFFYPTQQELAILESPELAGQGMEALEMPDQQQTTASTEVIDEAPAEIPATGQTEDIEEVASKKTSEEKSGKPEIAPKSTVGGIANQSEQENVKLPPPPENVEPVIIAEAENSMKPEAFGAAEKDFAIMEMDEEAKEAQLPSSREKNRAVKQDDDLLGAASKRTNSKSPKMLKEEEDTTFGLFTVVEHMPEFPGGEDSLTAYIQRNLELPYIEGVNFAGTAYVSFVVNEDGQVSDVVLQRGIWSVFDQEAVRLIKEMPAWIPGTQRGQPVRVHMVLPIQYTPQ